MEPKCSTYMTFSNTHTHHVHDAYRLDRSPGIRAEHPGHLLNGLESNFLLILFLSGIIEACIVSITFDQPTAMILNVIRGQEGLEKE